MFDGSSQVLPILGWLITGYACAFILRGIFAAVHADFYNPISQAIFKVTEPPLMLVRPFIPVIGRWDISCWILAWLLSVLRIVVLVALTGYSLTLMDLLQMILLGLLRMIDLLLQIYIFAIIGSVIASWINVASSGRPYSFAGTLFPLLHSITEPVLEPCRRILPAMGFIDFSPLIVFILLSLLRNVIRSTSVYFM